MLVRPPFKFTRLMHVSERVISGVRVGFFGICRGEGEKKAAAKGEEEEKKRKQSAVPKCAALIYTYFPVALPNCGK